MSLASQEKKIVKFVILTQGRTGSNMLVSLLDSHPEIKCFGESFNPKSSFGYDNWVKKSLLRKVENKYIKDYCVEAYLDTQLTVNSRDKIRATGFKLIYPGQFDRGLNFRHYWRTHNFKLISLVRRNLLRKYVSSKIAALEDVWSAEKHRGKTINIRIDIDDFKRETERLETIYKLIETLTVEFRGINVSYEELSLNKETTMNTISHYLGVKDFCSEELKPRTIKQNQARLDELIENYEEVSAALHGTEYEWFLKE